MPDECPECGSAALVYQEGCVRCPCGWTACADGGRRTLPSPGTVVVDKEDEEGRAVVVAVHPGSRADNWHIEALDATVADVNPGYSAADPVITVAFVDDVRDSVDGWRNADDLEIAAEEAGLRLYDYPAGRLAEAGP